MINTSELQEVCIRFTKSMARYLGNQKYYYGYVREEVKGDQVYMYYVTSHLDYIGRWLLMYTHHVTIESPEAPGEYHERPFRRGSPALSSVEQ